MGGLPAWPASSSSPVVHCLRTSLIPLPLFPSGFSRGKEPIGFVSSKRMSRVGAHEERLRGSHAGRLQAAEAGRPAAAQPKELEVAEQEGPRMQAQSRPRAWKSWESRCCKSTFRGRRAEARGPVVAAARTNQLQKDLACLWEGLVPPHPVPSGPTATGTCCPRSRRGFCVHPADAHINLLQTLQDTPRSTLSSFLDASQSSRVEDPSSP